jgi:hypothetical protein
LSKTPLTDMDNKTKILVRLDYDSHMAFSIKGAPYPVAKQFDYIEGTLDNLHYDLEKAVQILSKRKDVQLVKSEQPHYNSNPYILEIPYYNRGDGRYDYVAFRWIPTVQTYRKVWKKCLAVEKDYPSTRIREVALGMDLFGLRKGGAEKERHWFADRVA